MLINKKAQGLSITTIIVAVIGLIILVVIIMMITGKLGAFGEGLGRAMSCENVCNGIGMGKTGYDYDKEGCLGLPPNNKPKILPGKYSDVSDGEVCCCKV